MAQSAFLYMTSIVHARGYLCVLLMPVLLCILHSADTRRQLFLESIERHTRTKCGYATVADVNTMALVDTMPSFFLSETCKYLYLLFDDGNFINHRCACFVGIFCLRSLY